MALYPSPNPKPQYQETKPRIQANGGPRVVAELAGYCLAAGLALSTGILAVNYATPSRAVGLTQPATLAGKVSVSGISRSHGQSPGSNFQSQFAAAPSRAPARAPGGTISLLVPNFDMGAGISRASARVSGAGVESLIPSALSRSHGVATAQLSTHFPTTDIGGAISLASSRSLSADNLKSLLSAAPSRASTRVAGASTVAHITGIARAHGRLLGNVPLVKIHLWSLQSPDGNVWTLQIAHDGTVSAPIMGGRVLTVTPPVFQGTPVGIIWTPSVSNAGILSIDSGLSDGQLWASLIDPFMQRWSFYVDGNGVVSVISGTENHLLAAPSMSHGYMPQGHLSGAAGPVASLAGLGRAEGRAIATGIIVVGNATPSRAIGKAGPATLRFVGAGFEMGSGIARMLGSRARATGIITVYYATPSRSHPFRAWAPIQLWYDAVPARAFGYARCAITLAMQGQQPPTISRSTGGRTVSVHLKLHYATVPSRCTPRAVAVLQFTGGTTQAVAGLSRATGKAHALQLQTLSGPKIAMQGISRAEGRARTASTPTLLTIYFVTPSKAAARSYGQLETWQDTGPSRGMGGRALAVLTSSPHVGLQGLSRQTSRVRGAFLNIKPQLVGISLASSRALAPAPNSTLPVSVAPSRDVARTYSGVLEFLPITVVDIGGGRGLATSRAVATLKTTNAAQPSIGTCRTPGAFLGSQQPLASTSRETGLAIGHLALTGPSTIGLDGISCATSRTFADLHISLAGGWVMGHPRSYGAPPSYALALSGGRSLGHPRAVAVLAFTGATVQPIAGRSLDVAAARGVLGIVYVAAPSMGHSIATGQLVTLQALIGTSAAHPISTGAFDDPYAQAISRAHGYTVGGLLSVDAPLSGTSLDVGRLVAELTIPREIPHLVFVAKHRVFVFIAKDRYLVIPAKERRFLFFAGGGQ